jgi:photosystem II stability/assembly factor-like uncharacterized protein
MACGDEILKSTDNGDNWSSVYSTHPCVAIATSGGGVWIAATDDFAHKLIRSDDDGSTWDDVYTFTGAGELGTSLAYDKSGAWCVGTTIGNIYRSIDGGINWSLATISDGVPEVILTLASDGAGEWCAGGRASYMAGVYAAIWHSTNNGATWSLVYMYEEDPESTDIDVQVLDIATDGEGAWCATVWGNRGSYPSIYTISVFMRSTNGVDWAVAQTVAEDFTYAVDTDSDGLWLSGAFSDILE